MSNDFNMSREGFKGLKCKECGSIIPNKITLDEAKLFMEINHNINVCLKARH